MNPTREIGGNVFAVAPLDAWATFDLQPVLAPALAEVGGALAAISGEDDVAKLGPAVSRFFAALPAADLRRIATILLRGSTMDGVRMFGDSDEPVAFKKLARRMMDVWRLLYFAVEVNYPDFFAALASARDAAGARRSGASTESNSTGPAGDSSASDTPA